MIYTPEQLRTRAETAEQMLIYVDPRQLRAHAAALEELAALRAQLAERGAELSAAKAALETARKENDALRALQVGIKCAYGYRMDNGVCQLGYPGCACMDDLVATMEWGPDDLHAQANRRLLERAERAEAALAEAEKDARRWRKARTMLEAGTAWEMADGTPAFVIFIPANGFADVDAAIDEAMK